MRWLSPLRYPGGKGLLGDFVGSLIADCHPRPTCYVEPFAGGAGVGLRLLYDEHVESIVLNDLDPGIAAFWRIVFDRPDDLIAKIESATVDIDAWRHHHRIYVSGSNDDLELAFATFFLNRTNRSGILGARPIGGMEQIGKWKIDARFNREDLCERISVIGGYRNRVDIEEQHAIALLQSLKDRWAELFVYADPPYLDKGGDLYLDAMDWTDHQNLAGLLRDIGGLWMVTYNNDARIPEQLYPDVRCAEFGIAHTAGKQHMGSELAIFSDALSVDEMVGVGRGEARWLD